MVQLWWWISLPSKVYLTLKDFPPKKKNRKKKGFQYLFLVHLDLYMNIHIQVDFIQYIYDTGVSDGKRIHLQCRRPGVQSLGWEDPLEEGMATHFSILAWRILMDRGAWGAAVHQSVQFSRSVVTDSLQPHGLQHTRRPCLSPAPGAWSSSCPSSQWCHPTILSSVIHICIIYEHIYIYSPCMILYAPLHKCTDHPIIQSYTSLSLQRYIGYSPRPSYHWPKKFCMSEHEIKISILFSKAKELFLKVLVLKTAWQHVFIL